MKKILILSSMISLALPASAETVYTIPQGYTKVSIPAGTAGGPSLTAISANLLNDVAFSGAVTISADFDADPDSDANTTNTSQTVTAAGAGWTSGEWTAVPHLAYLENSTGADEAFLITANTTDALTVDGGFDLLASSRFPASTKVKIRKANTIGGLLGTTATPFTPNDLVFLWDGGGWESYIAFDGDWYFNSGSDAGEIATNVVVFPEEGLFVQRSETTAATLTFFGEVPEGAQASTVPGSSSSFVATRFPVGNSPEVNPTGVLLPNLNINSIPNWSSDDTVYLWTGTAWQGFIEFEGDWFFSTGPDAGNDANTFLVKSNSAVFVSRSSTGADAASPLAVPAPYTVETSE